MIHTVGLTGPRGNTISVYAAGHGPAVMLLHGFPLNHRMWLKQLVALSSRYKVLVPEFRGFGKSALLDAPYTLADLAQDVEFVRLSLANAAPMHLCGLSMGGYVAFEYWRSYSKHLSSLILSNTKPGLDPEAARSGRLAMAEAVHTHGTWATVEPMLPRLLSNNRPREEDTVVSQLTEMLQQPSPPAIAAAQVAMAGRRDFSSELASINLPTLVISSEDDVICPAEESRDWSSQIPGAEFSVIPQAGHLPPMENPAAFNAALESFVDRTLSR